MADEYPLALYHPETKDVIYANTEGQFLAYEEVGWKKATKAQVEAQEEAEARGEG